MYRNPHFLLIPLAALVLSGCGSDPTPASGCAAGEHKCIDGELAECGADGTFGTPVACEAPMACHAVDGKLDHCMVFTDGMSHDGMMHEDGMSHEDGHAAGTHDGMGHDGNGHEGDGHSQTGHDGMSHGDAK